MGHRDASGRLAVRRNHDVDWDSWPVQTYLTTRFFPGQPDRAGPDRTGPDRTGGRNPGDQGPGDQRPLHPADLAVIEHHSRFYRRFSPGSVDRSLEFGAGPNLYPLMLAAGVSRHIHAVEPSAASVAYLIRQLPRAEPGWADFYLACRRRQACLPESLTEALARVEVTRQSAAYISPGAYGLCSMHFVAESVTEDRREFRALCARFVASARPGGHLVAAFMENLGRYRLGDGSLWPGYPVDLDRVWDAFARRTENLELEHIDADATLPGYGRTGMVLLTARRRTD